MQVSVEHKIFSIDTVKKVSSLLIALGRASENVAHSSANGSKSCYESATLRQKESMSSWNRHQPLPGALIISSIPSA